MSINEPKPHERPTSVASIKETLAERTGRVAIDPNSRANNDYVRDVTFLLGLLEPTSLDEALNQYVEAGDRYREVAIKEIEQAVKARYPTATVVRAIGIVSDDYSEHELVIQDAAGNHINAEDDWPFEDPDFDDQWVITATEGACVFDDTVTIPLDSPRES